MAFELPLAYIYGDKFNQPIFGANNLSGELGEFHEGHICLQTQLAASSSRRRHLQLSTYAIKVQHLECRELLACCTRRRSCRKRSATQIFILLL